MQQFVLRDSGGISRGRAAPGSVFLPFVYAEAAANQLTHPQLDPFGKIPGFKYCAVRVEAVV